MAKIASPFKRPTRNGGFNGGREAALQIIVDRTRRNISTPLAESVPIKLMELRPCMCRWPIGDPQHFATFRFCGSGCPSGAVYCKTHDAKAHALNRPRTLRTNKLQGQPAIIVA
jgi:hypothetical protein